MNEWDYLITGALSGLFTVVLGGISLFLFRNRLLEALEKMIDSYFGKLLNSIQEKPDYYRQMFKPLINDMIKDVGGGALKQVVPKFKIMDVVGAVAMGLIMPKLGPLLGSVAGETGGQIIDAVAEKREANPFK